MEIASVKDLKEILSEIPDETILIIKKDPFAMVRKEQYISIADIEYGLMGFDVEGQPRIFFLVDNKEEQEAHAGNFPSVTWRPTLLITQR